jgi:hypothetical protein
MIPSLTRHPDEDRSWTMKALILLSLALGTALLVPVVHAGGDTLLVERVQVESAGSLPTRGSSMADVEARFGAPTRKYPAIAGPDSIERNPPITRWAYPGFSVYFEHDHVVDAVANKSSPTEIGPAPAQR